MAKCAYVKRHGSLPPSYAKNYQRGMDRFLCLHLGIEPAALTHPAWGLSDRVWELGPDAPTLLAVVELDAAPRECDRGLKEVAPRK